MSGNQQLDERQLEELKKRYGIDERIAERYDLPEDRVKEDFDPRFVRLVLRYLDQTRVK